MVNKEQHTDQDIKDLREKVGAKYTGIFFSYKTPSVSMFFIYLFYSTLKNISHGNVVCGKIFATQWKIFTLQTSYNIYFLTG